MRIGIFVVMAGRQAGGPETYEVELIRALARLDRENEYCIYCTGDHAVRAIGVRQGNVVYRLLWPTARWLSIPLTLPTLLVKDRVDLFHATFTPPPLLPKRLVFTMHGLVNFVHPEFYPKRLRWRLNKLMTLGVQQGTRILCVSQTVREDVHRIFGVPLERLLVAYHGVGEHFVPMPAAQARQLVAQTYGFDWPYLLYVGKIQRGKNLATLMQAYATYRAQTGGEAKLVLVGKVTESTHALDACIESLQLRAHVIHLGYIPHTQLPLLYSAARMFLFPSLFESFGLPVLEAMACGTPVLTSNVAALPEIVGDAAILVNPTSSDAIAKGIIQLDTSPALRQRLVAKGFRRVQRFTWDACAQTTLAAYTEVYNS